MSDRYLIIDDDEAFASVLQRSLRRRKLEAHTAHDATQALQQCSKQVPTRIVLDLKLGKDNGLRLIKQLKEAQPRADIVMLTGYSSIATAVNAVKLGALNYLCKPVNAAEVISAFEPNEQELTPVDDTPPSFNRLAWEHINQVLDKHDGNISATARALGMHRRTLQRKLRKRPVKG